MLAIGEMRGNLAELTRRPARVPDGVGAATVVFPSAVPCREAPCRRSGAEEGRRLRPRTVRVS
jgi:hypothetical protein